MWRIGALSPAKLTELLSRAAVLAAAARHAAAAAIRALHGPGTDADAAATGTCGSITAATAAAQVLTPPVAKRLDVSWKPRISCHTISFQSSFFQDSSQKSPPPNAGIHSFTSASPSSGQA